MTVISIRLAGAALALALTLGGSASALADFDRDHRGQAAHREQSWRQHRPQQSWVWVCRHRVCAWEPDDRRDHRRDAQRHPWPPRPVFPRPGVFLPPVVWAPPYATFSWQLNF